MFKLFHDVLLIYENKSYLQKPSISLMIFYWE